MLKYCVTVGPNPVECATNLTQLAHPKEESRNG